MFSMLRVVVVIVTVFVSNASAAPRSVMVMPIEMPAGTEKHVKADLTAALVHAIKQRAGSQVTMGGSSLNDVAQLLGCALREPSCRTQILASLLVDEVVGCTVQRGLKDDQLVARLVYLTSDGKIRHASIPLGVGGVKQHGATMRKQAARFFAGQTIEQPPPTQAIDDEAPPARTHEPPKPVEPKQDPEPVKPIAIVPEKPPAPADPPRVVSPRLEPAHVAAPPHEEPARFTFSAVRKRTWIVAGVGIGATSLGVGALLLANGKQSEIDSAPTRTVDDLDHLVELEASARFRYRVSNALFVVGGLALGTAAVLAILDQRSERRVAITPIQIDRGMGLALHIEAP
jgi:hypothetical protein